jgi:hypothetical protein
LKFFTRTGTRKWTGLFRDILGAILAEKIENQSRLNPCVVVPLYLAPAFDIS